MNLDRERERLTEYTAQLEASEAKLLAMRADVEALREVVSGLKKLVETDEDKRQRTNPNAAIEMLAAKFVTREREKGLKTLLAQELDARGRLTADEAVILIHEGHQLGDVSRNTIVSRLGDLVREGEAGREGRGVYVSKQRAQLQPHQQPLGQQEGAES